MENGLKRHAEGYSNKREDVNDNEENENEPDVDKYMQLIQFQSVRNRDGLETAISVQWKDEGGVFGEDDNVDKDAPMQQQPLLQRQRYSMARPLQLSTLLQPDELAPLFHGTQWAGTRVWHAAVSATQYILQHYAFLLKSTNTVMNDTTTMTSSLSSRRTTILELGCGLGVPGMVLHALYPDTTSVYLTDQGSIISQLETNLQRNFADYMSTPETSATAVDTPASTTDTHTKHIHARGLDWYFMNHDDTDDENHDNSDEHGTTLTTMDAFTTATTDAIDNANNTFWKTQFAWNEVDICFNCDCVYEPLYGKSYLVLAHLLSWVLQQNPKAIVLTSVERRNQDGVEVFLEVLRQSAHVSYVHRVWHDDEFRIEIYQAHGVMT